MRVCVQHWRAREEAFGGRVTGERLLTNFLGGVACTAVPYVCGEEDRPGESRALNMEYWEGGGGERGRGPATEIELERPGSERFEVAESVAEKRVWMLAAFACAAAVVQPRYVLPPPQQGP
jgi:hypothetical protein